MNIRIAIKARQQGTVILMCLMISAIIGLTLASYLILTQGQMVSVARSQTWNATISLTEAGIEDGLQLINKYAGTFDQLTNWSGTATADGWTALSPNVFTVRRYLGGSYYDAYVTNAATTTPTVAAVGTIPWTYQYASAPGSFYAQVGGPPSSTLGSTVRKVAVKTKVDALFNAAMAAIYTINLNGNFVKTDSFDSADPSYSTGGIYDPNKNKAGGDVVTDDTIINSISSGNADIRGHVRTGPKGTVYVGDQGVVGDLNYTANPANYGTIQQDWFADDMNVAWPDVTMPKSANWLPSWFIAQNVTINGINYAYYFPSSGDYVLSGLTGSIYIGTNAAVRLWITGTVNLSGQTEIDIAPVNASLVIYMSGSSFSTSGQAAINNYMQNAADFAIYGLPSCTSISINGNASITGVIYAPEADLTIGGGGNDYYDFVGSSVSKTVKMNGHMNFHYDENLRKVGYGRGYIPTNWKEL